MDDIYDMMMKRPEASPVSRRELDKMVRCTTNSVPAETLEKAHRAQQYAIHNAEVDKKKARKREIKQLAKKVNVPVATLKKMMGRA